MTSKLSLTPVKPRRISDQVLEQLRELIFRGELAPGEQLMPERELAVALNVSRTTVRDAINKLVATGLLEQHQGQGTFVRSPESQERNPLAATLAGPEGNLVDLLEVRMGLECNAAALAAQRADEKDIRFIEKSIEEMREEIHDARLGTEPDVSFHMAIAYATKNPVHVRIMRNFYDYLFYGVQESRVQLYEDSSEINRIIEQHVAVLESIRNRDPEGAFTAMRRHIQHVIEFLRRQES